MTSYWDPLRPRLSNGRVVWMGHVNQGGGTAIPNVVLTPDNSPELSAALQWWLVGAMLPKDGGFAWAERSINVIDLGMFLHDWIACPEDAARKWFDWQNSRNVLMQEHSIKLDVGDLGL